MHDFRQLLDIIADLGPGTPATPPKSPISMTHPMRRYMTLTERVMINEVVLATPIETVLAPYLARAPSDAVKKWLSTNFRNWLIKTPENLHKLTYLPPNADDKQKKAFEFDDLYEVRLSQKAQNMVAHIMDFFGDTANQNLPRLDRMSVDDVRNAADQWVKQMNAKAMKQPDDPTEVETVMEFPGGFRMVNLVGRNALEREGAQMGHCVGGDHHCQLVLSAKTHKIYSLRDANNEPRATVEVANDSKRTTEIKGRGNKAPVRRYWPMLRQFIEEYGINVDNDHKNVGLLKIQDPATGNLETLSVEEFKDMVLDPNNERGKDIVANYGLQRRNEADTTIGLFNALYGTDRMTDQLVQAAFEQSSDLAVQTVQHYGNKLTPEQLIIAFKSMTANGYGVEAEDIKNLYKELLQTAKPDDALVKQILDGLSGHSQFSQRREVHRDAEFVAALSQVMPDTYAKLLIDGGPEVLENELAQQNSRSAGPYFVFISRGGLTPLMVEKAFAHQSKDALKRARREKLVFSPELLEAAYAGLAQLYWGRTMEEQEKVLNGLTEYAKPDKAVLNSVFASLDDGTMSSTEKTFAIKLLIIAKKHVPESLDKGTVEKAVLAIDSDEMYRDYLENEPVPPMEIQERLWAKASRNDYADGKYLRWMRKIDPKFFLTDLIKKLKPEPVGPTKQTQKQIPDKAKPGSHKYINIKVKKTADEMAEERSQNRHNAIREFLSFLKPMLQEPRVEDGVTDDDALDPASPKFKAGMQAFQVMGKSALFATAVNAIARKTLISKAVGSRSHSGSIGSVGDFVNNLDKLSPENIAHIIDNAGYGNQRMRELINHRPDLVPTVLMQKGYNGKIPDRVGKLEWKGLDKDKTFDALEAVWASTKVPEGYKDNFTLAVFKRFKPSPAKLLALLDKADNEDATKYVLKKTKKPSVELLKFVLDGWPRLLLEVPNIPDEMLPDIFKEDLNIALHLMNRDLRDYGTDSRSKWANKNFRQKINRDSDEFKKYEAAAQAAGKEKEFNRYARQAELEDSSSDLFDETGKVDLKRVAEHLDEYNNRTLLKIAERDHSTMTIRLYFARFEPWKLSILLGRGLLKTNDWQHKIRKGVLSKVDQTKLHDAVMIGLTTKDEGIDLSAVVSEMRNEQIPIDDPMIIAILNNKHFQGYGSESVKKSLLKAGVSDAVKDYVAENLPQNMDDIDTPNAAMVKSLFDNYGHITKGSGKNSSKLSVNYFFTKISKGWFNRDPSGVWFKWRDNPIAYKLMKAEAIRRGGQSAKIALAVFKHLASLKKGSEEEKGNNYYSGSGQEPDISMMPKNYNAEEE